jgi:hypothetical protein
MEPISPLFTCCMTVFCKLVAELLMLKAMAPDEVSEIQRRETELQDMIREVISKNRGYAEYRDALIQLLNSV